MKLRKILAVTLVLALVVTLFASCEKKDTSNIKVGVLAPLTGAVAVYGQAVKNAVQLAFDEVNAAGGVLGRQIEPIFEDEEGDATKATLAYDKLVGDGVVAIIGDVTSKPTISVAQKSVADNMPIITPTATAAEVTTYGSNVFRACFLDPFQGQSMAKFAQETLGAKKVAVLYANDDDYSTGIAEAFKAKSEELGMTVVNYETFASADQDFKAQLTKIAQNAPDAVMVPYYYNTNALVVKQAKEVGLTTKWLGGDGWEGTIEALGDDKNAADGAYFSNHYFKDDPKESLQAFLAAYEAKYGEKANALAALGYDAAKLLIAAIEKAGKADSASIVAALPDTSIDGVTGSIAFQGSGDPVKSITVIEIADGAYKLAGTVNP